MARSIVYNMQGKHRIYIQEYIKPASPVLIITTGEIMKVKTIHGWIWEKNANGNYVRNTQKYPSFTIDTKSALKKIINKFAERKFYGGHINNYS